VTMRLRERLEIRALAEKRYRAGGADLYQLPRLADSEGEDAVLDWLRYGLPTPRLDMATLSHHVLLILAA
jgi:hypothetical protein